MKYCLPSSPVEACLKSSEKPLALADVAAAAFAEVAGAADVAAAPLPLPLLHAAMPATPAVPAMPASMVRRETGKPTSRGLGDVGRIERVMHASLGTKWLSGRGD